MFVLCSGRLLCWLSTRVPGPTLVGGWIALFPLPTPMALHLRTLGLLELLFPWLSLQGRMAASRGHLVLMEFEAARETQSDESVAPV